MTFEELKEIVNLLDAQHITANYIYIPHADYDAICGLDSQTGVFCRSLFSSIDPYHQRIRQPVNDYHYAD